MPQVFNINPPVDGLGVNVRSLRCWFWPSVTDTSAEVAPAAAHYVEYDAFSQNNANGSNLGHGRIDCGPAQTAMQMYGAGTVQELLQSVFGAAI